MLLLCVLVLLLHSCLDRTASAGWLLTWMCFAFLQTEFSPKVILQQPTAADEDKSLPGWWRMVYFNLVHSNTNVRAHALGVAERATSMISELDSQPEGLRAQLHDAVVEELMAQNGILAKLARMASSKTEDQAKDACAAWGWLSRFAGAKIVKDGHLAAFLKV